MDKFDLIPNIDEMEFLFVLESPHTNEINANTPCIGKTGLRMTSEIFPESEKPFGELLKSNYIDSSKFGIMNSFNFPLGISNELNSEQLRFSKLKDVEWIKGVTVRQEHYAKLLAILSECRNSESLFQYKDRLTKYVTQTPKLKYIIFCGFISQSMYLQAFNQKIPSYNRAEPMNASIERNISLIFVNHPSEKNEKWDFKKSSINL